MIISNNTDPQTVLKKTHKELQKGSGDSRHPFRYLSLSSYNPEEKEPNIRMVILREIANDWRIFVYTDARTSKVNELNQLNRAALLFWHSYHKTQVTLKTTVSLHHNNETAEKYWKKDVHGSAQKAYTPLVSPGTKIETPEEAHQWPDNYTMDHFCVLECDPFDMQILQINGKEHRRLAFQRTNNTDSWKGQWIAP